MREHRKCNWSKWTGTDPGLCSGGVKTGNTTKGMTEHTANMIGQSDQEQIQFPGQKGEGQNHKLGSVVSLVLSALHPCHSCRCKKGQGQDCPDAVNLLQVIKFSERKCLWERIWKKQFGFRLPIVKGQFFFGLTFWLKKSWSRYRWVPLNPNNNTKFD